MNKIFLAAMLFAISFSSVAGGRALYVEKSNEGETMDQFVLRIAPAISFKTKFMKYEICGVIESDGRGYIVELKTSNREDSCSLGEISCDSITIHSHPPHALFTFSENDYVTSGYLVHGGFVKFQNGRGTEVVISRK